MMRNLKKALIVFVLSGFFSFPGWGAAETDYGKGILQKTVRAYQELQTYQAVVFTTMAMGKSVSTRSTLSVERPNKLALLTRSVMSGVTLISDGKKIYVYLPASGKYTVKTAPEDFERFVEVLGPDLMAQGDNCSLYALLGLLNADSCDELIEGVEKIQALGEEDLAGTKTHHLRLKQNGETVDLWIDTANYLIKKFRVEVDLSKPPDGSDPPDGETGNFIIPEEPTQILIEEIHQEVKVNEPIPDGVFTFIPPEGAQETDDILSLTTPDTSGWETRTTSR